VKDLRRMVKVTMRSNLVEHKVRYNLKRDKQMLMPIDEDMDVRMILKRNSEHGYLYMGGNDDMRMQVLEGAQYAMDKCAFVLQMWYVAPV